MGLGLKLVKGFKKWKSMVGQGHMDTLSSPVIALSSKLQQRLMRERKVDDHSIQFDFDFNSQNETGKVLQMRRNFSVIVGFYFNSQMKRKD